MPDLSYDEAMPNLKGEHSEGTLYIVSTPIGNLKDITLRAIEVLSNVHLIAAEDTRHAKILLDHYQIGTPTTSFYDFNKKKKMPILIDRLKKGEKVALISDAGTPGISDPAFTLVRECIANDLTVDAIPGATAFVPALILSGLPTDRFVFEGFLPVKKGRKKRIQELKEEKRTIIFYESPHRILKTLRELLEHLGNRQAAVVRELTKKFEEVRRGDLNELYARFSQSRIRGEFVLVIEGKGK